MTFSSFGRLTVVVGRRECISVYGERRSKASMGYMMSRRIGRNGRAARSPRKGARELVVASRIAQSGESQMEVLRSRTMAWPPRMFGCPLRAKAWLGWARAIGREIRPIAAIGKMNSFVRVCRKAENVRRMREILLAEYRVRKGLVE